MSPRTRCVLGGLAGLAALASSFPLRARGYRITSDAVTGAGTVILFGALWAACILYVLLPFWAAFAGMVAVTLSCGFLAVRRASQVIALFGVIGGFATPLLLSQGAEQPYGLYAYVLLLNGAVMALVRARRWPLLATIASLATPLLVLTWLATHRADQHVEISLLFCGASALVFALGSLGGEDIRARAAPIVGSLTPFCFALYFTHTASVQRNLLPTALLLAVLEALSVWLALRMRLPALLAAAAIGAVATLATWCASTQLTTPLAWQAAGVAFVLAGVLHSAFELARRRESEAALYGDSAALAALGFGLCVLIGAGRAQSTPPWPWLAAAAAVGALLTRQVQLGGRPVLLPLAALGLALTHCIWRHVGALPSALQPAGVEAAVVVALGAAALAPRWACARTGLRAWAGAAAVVACAVLLLERADASAFSATNAALVVGTTVALAALGLLGARELPHSFGYAAVALAAWVAQRSWAAAAEREIGVSVAQTGFTLATAALLPLAPLLDRRALGAPRGAWRFAAAFAALWALPVQMLLQHGWSRAPDGAGLAWAALAAGVGAQSVWRERQAEEADSRRTAGAVGFAWLAALACSLAAFAFAVEVDRAEDLIGVALSACAVAWVARAARHDGLRWIALALSVYTLARTLILLAVALSNTLPLERSGMPVLHWLSYEVGVPALALLATAAGLRASEREPVGRTPRLLPPLPHAASIVALLGIVALFLWVNVEVVNLCSEGPSYALSLERLPTRDVALSVAWTLYSLGLLMLGVRLRGTALRWTSLAFFLATIAKVFLYDLGELRGLHRVASLVGLALALLAVSMLYQRFVFGARRPVPT